MTSIGEGASEFRIRGRGRGRGRVQEIITCGLYTLIHPGCAGSAPEPEDHPQRQALEGKPAFADRKRGEGIPDQRAILFLSGLTREHDSNRGILPKATSHPEAIMNPALVSPTHEHRRFRSKSGHGVIRTIHRLAVTALILTTACGTFGKIEDPLESNTTPAATPVDISAAAARQMELEATAQEIHAQLAEFHQRAGWRQRGYFTNSEHDDIEWLLFRYVQNHRAFWGEIDRLGGVDLALTPDSKRPGAHLLVLHAGLALADASMFLVAEFHEDPVAVAKLNEFFYRSEIPADTYEKIALAATNADRRKALKTTWGLHERDLSGPNRFIPEVDTLDPELTSVLASLAPLWSRVEARSAQIDTARNQILTDLDHSLAAEASRASDRSVDAVAYETRALVFKNVSRIKDPAARLIKFSTAQKQELHDLLRPGDILLSYTAGYISDVFIPGTFKHGITYVGVEAERETVGLTMASLPELDRSRADQFSDDIANDRMSDGSKADLIEAVAEGVKFSNLDTILDTHVNRLLLLRPLINEAERTEFLAGVFAYVGDPYDFRFDFADASRQVCTEVIYRALNEKSGIDFKLTPRAGHPTLSADDIVLYHFATPGHFEILAYAEEDPAHSDHRARIWTDAAAENRLKKRMVPTEN